MIFKPKTKLGIWAVLFNSFFLIVILISIFLVKVLGVLSFEEGNWWDITATIFILPIIAMVLGLISLKYKEKSRLVYISIIISILEILFLLLHSLFISD